MATRVKNGEACLREELIALGAYAEKQKAQFIQQ